MVTLLCISTILAIILFFYLLNTTRKKTSATTGKKEYTPVYLSIADDPNAVIQSMDKCEYCGQVLLS